MKIVAVRYLSEIEQEKVQKVYDITVEPYANYILANGQVVHNSGKGFAIEKFMDASSFKRRDVDEFKLAFLALAQFKENHKEIANLNLKTPKDVAALHAYVKKYDVKNKTLNLLLTDLSQDHLPNILFDITGKELSDITDVIPRLLEAGYSSKNINLTWVLTNFEVAIKNNASRARVVPDEIMFDTHDGAATTMTNILRGNIPHGLDGQINVILNNRENTIPWVDDTGKAIVRQNQIVQTRDVVTKKSTSDPSIVVKDFLYVRVKEAGKPLKSETEIKHDVFDWIKQNVPKSTAAKLFS